MITTCDIVEFDDAFICRDERTLLIVESKGANSEAREQAHKERYIDNYKYLEVNYDDLKEFIHRVRRLRQESNHRCIGGVDELLEFIRGDRPL